MQQDSCSRRLSRRELMRLLGMGAGFGIASAFRDGGDLAAAVLQPGSAARKVTFPKGSIIRTLLKDLSPDDVKGATLIHEHMSLTNWRDPATSRQRRFLEDVDFIVEEMQAARKDGIGCIVDGGHPEMGRNLEHLKQVSSRSGIPIVGGGGHYSQAGYPPAVARMSEDQLVDEMVQEVTSGHLGAFGEIGTSVQITPDERKVLRAVGKAHLRTGLPIVGHTDNGKGAEKTPLEQLDIYESVGVKLQNVVIGHLDGFDDPQLHAAVAKRGAFVGFDRVSGGETDAVKVRNILKFLEAGYADKLLLSSDFAQEKNTKRAGGPGYALTLTRFVPKLRDAGVKEETLHSVMFDNPRRLLAFVPKKA